MRLVISIIRPYHSEFVQKALEREEVVVTSIGEVATGRREAGYKLIYREREVIVREPKLRIEIMVENWQVEEVVNIIRASTAAGCPGHVSDAQIMVLALEDVASERNSGRQLSAARNNSVGVLCPT